MKEDEISFLALYIQPFLKVQNTSVRTLLVYGTSQSFTHLIKTWLYQEFKERIHVIGYIPLYQLEEEVKSKEVDLIISSTAIEKKTDIPIISIMQLPMEADRIQIENFISRQAMLSQSVSIFRSIGYTSSLEKMASTNFSSSKILPFINRFLAHRFNISS